MTLLTRSITPLIRLSSTSALLMIPNRSEWWVSKKFPRSIGGVPSFAILCNASLVRSVASKRAPNGVILSDRSRQLWSLSKLMFSASEIWEPFLRMSAVNTSSDCLWWCISIYADTDVADTYSKCYIDRTFTYIPLKVIRNLTKIPPPIVRISRDQNLMHPERIRKQSLSWIVSRPACIELGIELASWVRLQEDIQIRVWLLIIRTVDANLTKLPFWIRAVALYEPVEIGQSWKGKLAHVDINNRTDAGRFQSFTVTTIAL